MMALGQQLLQVPGQLGGLLWRALELMKPHTAGVNSGLQGRLLYFKALTLNPDGLLGWT